MLLSDEEVNARLSSPLNLLNRLREASKKVDIVSLPPKIEDLVENVEDKLSASQNLDKAAVLLGSALDQLQVRLCEVSKPEKLSSIAKDMNAIIHSAAERNKSNGDVHNTQVIVYAPQVMAESEFETIDVLEAQ